MFLSLPAASKGQLSMPVVKPHRPGYTISKATTHPLYKEGDAFNHHKLGAQNHNVNWPAGRKWGHFRPGDSAQAELLPRAESWAEKKIFGRVKDSFRGLLKIPSDEISLGTAGQTLGKHWANTGQTLAVFCFSARKRK